jgi:predicted DNA-binding ribbon-helix-helix protein
MKQERRFVRSRVRRRTVRIGKHKTSLTVEEEFWQALREIALVQQLPVSKLFADIDRNREHANLSSAVLNHYRRFAEEQAGRKDG